eukprot:TRINITY_DN8800_c0_g6_i1.p1 TRINITY_DN8800_c0_g6~~TRINITY_DN8800_c0_g6_i1.p1  ORF type:complete len:583 (-),score=80.68 TRINITY_DN8800_c0_g6_i1:102-1850(-)
MFCTLVARKHTTLFSLLLLILVMVLPDLANAGNVRGSQQRRLAEGVCKDSCWRNYGFLEDDCTCQLMDSGSSFWVCTKRAGTVIKPKYCEIGLCNGCHDSLPTSPPSFQPSPASSPSFELTSPAVGTQSDIGTTEKSPSASIAPESHFSLHVIAGVALALSTVIIVIVGCCIRDRQKRKGGSTTCGALGCCCASAGADDPHDHEEGLSRAEAIRRIVAGLYADSEEGKDRNATVCLEETQHPASDRARSSKETEEVPSKTLVLQKETKLPGNWFHQNASTPFKSLEPLSHTEMIQFQDLLDDTYKCIRTRDRYGAEIPVRLLLRHVLRVEHSDMWGRYAESRNAVVQQRAGGCTAIGALGGQLLTTQGAKALHKDTLKSDVNEAYLWHGTCPRSALGIIEEGFKMDLAGDNGASNMFGPGAYFAECSSKSDEYARDDSSGIYKNLHCLLLCRVTLGEMIHMTRGGAATHGMIKAALDSGSYDSVLGDREASVGTYREFVVYDEQRVYPEYVLLYSREFNPSEALFKPVPSQSSSTAGRESTSASASEDERVLEEEVPEEREYEDEEPCERPSAAIEPVIVQM